MLTHVKLRDGHRGTVRLDLPEAMTQLAPEGVKLPDIGIKKQIREKEGPGRTGNVLFRTFNGNGKCRKRLTLNLWARAN
jgi:hypothetical protein